MMKRTVDMYRRRILQGAGGVIFGLPALESFMSRKAYAQAAKKTYAVFMQQQNGCIQGTSGDPQLFWPSQIGQITTDGLGGADANKTVSELKEYAPQLLMVRGVNWPFGNPVGCGHSSGCNQSLSAARLKGTGRFSTPVSESADVRIARMVQVGKDPLTLYAGRKGTFIDDAFSYGAGGAVRPGENNPLNVYMRLFAGGVPTTPGATPADSQAEMTKLVAKKKSVNDLLRSQIQTLMNRPELSKVDKDRLNVHFQSIRDLEIGMGGVMPGPAPDPGDLLRRLQEVNGTHTANGTMETVVKLQLELIAFAFASDRNQIATLQVGGGNDHTQYMVDGALAPQYHFISHRVLSDGSNGAGISNAVQLHHGIDRIHARYFKHLLDKLSQHALPDGQPLLKSTAAVWLNSLSSGPPHGTTNIPHIVAGSANGFLKQGWYVDAGGVTNNMFLNTIITAVAAGGSAAAAPVTDFGDATLNKDVISAMIA